MAINDLPGLAALKTRMQWHQERQRVLAQNVSNSDTPNFRPRDLVEPKFDRNGNNVSAPMSSVQVTRTNAGHISGSGANDSVGKNRKAGYETRPAGNAVNLEEEMMKVSANQMDYAAATTLYSRSLALLKTAVGRR